ncbi:TMEM175 family protein [Companilactobacillus nuruki]|uniref:DUF1211 domain-containing membrane protein n=1 Tax=Companilactobacillus nuruki TaxID=1993540 RepID=A0A2N7AQZ4_9LACO|nr:TMEM175 family protein [Companilactobacillus nuruki]PMD67777.1 hypothetical protein CBP76_12680 [Companilactobacillus nuruki]
MTKGRLESFTDAILAIIMTIMALEIHTPSAPTYKAFGTVLIPLFAYFVSFFGLTNLWIAHHHLFKNVKYISYRSVFANMCLLFWVTMVPISTSWVADFPQKALPERFFILVQLGWFIFIDLLIHSIEKDNPQIKDRLHISNWWTNVLFILFLIFPLPYSGLVIGTLVMIRVPILWIQREKDHELD